MSNLQRKATSVTKTASPKRFVFLLLDRFTMLSFAGAIEPLRIANRVSGKSLYSWKLAGETGREADRGLEIGPFQRFTQVAAEFAVEADIRVG